MRSKIDRKAVYVSTALWNCLNADGLKADESVTTVLNRVLRAHYDDATIRNNNKTEKELQQEKEKDPLGGEEFEYVDGF